MFGTQTAFSLLPKQPRKRELWIALPTGDYYYASKKHCNLGRKRDFTSQRTKYKKNPEFFNPKVAFRKYQFIDQQPNKFWNQRIL